MQAVIIGIDFDNTIVCYHDVFYAVAFERGLIPADFPKDKEKIRNYLRQQKKENLWTEIQGYVYGKAMFAAKPFPGVVDFFKSAREKNIKVYIISHRTKYPYIGVSYDLHKAARLWIDEMQLDVLGVFFLESKQEKLEKISICRCTHFIDDLPEILLDPVFPQNTRKILFSREDKKQYELQEMIVLPTWDYILKFFMPSAYA